MDDEQPYVKVHDENGQKIGYVSPHRPVSCLPTIDSGEPLRWDEVNVLEETTEDPFSDSVALQHSRHSAVPFNRSLPSRPPSQVSAQHGYSRGQSPIPSSIHAPPTPQPTSQLYNRSPSGTPVRFSRSAESAHMYAGSPKYVDHFRHDTEAYASGTYSRATYRPSRSRSPTPAIDDDYHIVGNDSIHYTGIPHDTDEDDLEPEESLKDVHDIYDEKDELLDDGEQTPMSDVPETPVETRHFGPAPTGRVLRRHKTKKRVQLTNGNLVVDLPVPPKLVLPRVGDPEVMKMRYTAVTCDPDDFEKSGFFLRQNESGRRTELFICITMYNASSLLTSMRVRIKLMIMFRKTKSFSVGQCMASCET
jgi:chitin synthase